MKHKICNVANKSCAEVVFVFLLLSPTCFKLGNSGTGSKGVKMQNAFYFVRIVGQN